MVRALGAIALATTPAAAERDWHGSVGAGSSLVLTGSGGDRFRFDAALDVKPGSRYGVGLAWRAVDADHRGLVIAGVVYEGAAARPRLVLDLHGDVGVDLDAEAPLAGGGVRGTLTLLGPVGLVLDGGAYVVFDGIDDSRLQLQTSTLLVVRW
jgi:hypothetical protein